MEVVSEVDCQYSLRGNFSTDISAHKELSRLYSWAFNHTSPNLVVNLTCVRFVEGNLCAELAMIHSSLTRQGKTISFLMPESGPFLNHVLRNGFGGYCGLNSKLSDGYNTIIPFIRLSRVQDQEFNDYASRVLTRAQGLTSNQLSEVLDICGEVFGNFGCYAGSESSLFICGQYMPNKKRLLLTISDDGPGIAHTVKRYPPKASVTASDAVLWAMEDGNSSKGRNGMGLARLANGAHTFGYQYMVSTSGVIFDGTTCTVIDPSSSIVMPGCSLHMIFPT